MAFVCAIDSPVLPDPDEPTVVIGIGYDDELDLKYSLVVGIEAAPGGAFELYFFHQEIGPTGEEEPPIFSSKYLGSFIPRACRRLIAEQLLSATRLLVTVFIFDEIYFSTYDEDLPPKAVTKFLQISRTLQSCGYLVVEQRSMYRRRLWTAKLLIDPRLA